VIETIAARYMIHGSELEYYGDEVLSRAHEQLQHEAGRELVAKLWNSEVPVLVQIKHEEHRPHDSYYWDGKELELRIDLNPVMVQRFYDPFYIPQMETIHVPHFQYFPKDWVCIKCGCIVDGLHSPRLCDRCGAPRDTRKKAILAMGG
jgi:hypothetical protein